MTSSTGTFTYWSLLGLSPGSDSAQIRSAFRREAKRWHPDVNSNNRNAEERLKWIIKAYKVLNDPQKRFEWEIAGKPSFSIEEFSPVQAKSSREVPTAKSPNDDSTFSPAEILLLLFIATFSLVFLNTFIL